MSKAFINDKGLIDEGDGWCNSLEQHDYEVIERVVDETHKLICNYLYSNNIHLIKISKDEADTAIYPYKVADAICEQLKERINEIRS